MNVYYVPDLFSELNLKVSCYHIETLLSFTYTWKFSRDAKQASQGHKAIVSGFEST